MASSAPPPSSVQQRAPASSDGGVTGGSVGSNTTNATATTAAAAADNSTKSSTKHAYVTLITSDSFLPGIQVLLYSLRQTGSTVPIVVLATKQVSKHTRAVIRRLQVKLKLVEAIPNPHAGDVHVDGWVNSGYTKLHIWGLVEYDKIVYIDADCLVEANVDELFDLDSNFAAAPDVFPPDRFNAGVMVVAPDATVLAHMRSVIDTLPSHDGGDTGFLNSYFPHWWRADAPSRLPFAFNAQRTMHWMTHAKAPGYWEAVKPLRIVHYSSTPKPWDSEGAARKGPLEMRWWEAFVSQQLQGSGGAMLGAAQLGPLAAAMGRGGGAGGAAGAAGTKQ